jgi:hypothetical protein
LGSAANIGLVRWPLAIAKQVLGRIELTPPSFY